MELATVNDENPCGNRGSGAVCAPLALAGTKDKKWGGGNRTRDVGVSWVWKDDAHRQPLALEHEELAVFGFRTAGYSNFIRSNRSDPVIARIHFVCTLRAT